MYYGYIIVVCAEVLILASSPGHSFGINQFVEYWINEIEIKRTILSTVWLIVSIISAISLPLFGHLIDKYGTQTTTKIITTSFLATLILGSFQNSVFSLSLFLFLMRFLGPECLVLTAMSSVNRFFHRLRGRAMAFLALGDAALMIFPSVFQYMNESLGWRWTYRVLAAIFFLPLIGVCIFIRNSPEEMGLQIDGGEGFTELDEITPTPDDDDKQEQGVKVRSSEGDGTLSVTFREAVKSPAFIAVCFIDSCAGLFWAGLNFHVVDIFKNRGLEGNVAVIYVPLTLSLSLSQFIFGAFLVDKLSIRKKKIAYGLINFGLAASMFLALAGSSSTFLIVFSFLFGLFVGMKESIGSVIMAVLFGTKSYGKIQGVNTACKVVATGLGPGQSQQINLPNPHHHQ